MIDLLLKEANVPAHLDIEEDIRKKQNGQITFTIRMNNGVIVDYNKTEYVDTRAKYFGNSTVAEFRVSVKRTAEKQPPVTRNN